MRTFGNRQAPAFRCGINALEAEFAELHEVHPERHCAGIDSLIARSIGNHAREFPHMILSLRRPLPCHGTLLAAAALIAASLPAAAVDYPVTPGQRSTAQQVASQGVALSELAPNAPDSYTVKRGDTLWDISKLYLLKPWRWPELWGMNLDQIRNPHLIYPGQMLFLDKSGGRARLRMGKPVDGGTVKLSPQVRSEAIDGSAIPSVPMHLVAPFLNQAIVFDADQLAASPRVVATQEGRVQASKGETAYVRGDVGSARAWSIFREATPLADPVSGEVLGYEARFVGTAEAVKAGEVRKGADGVDELVPATFTITNVREEVGTGDRLMPTPVPESEAYTPHAPGQPVDGRVIRVYGDALYAGQNQIISFNRGKRDGIERGHVLAVWRAGKKTVDRTDPDKPMIRLPDERTGMLFVFRVFDRVSYGLILQSQDIVKAGDLLTQP
jgi:LysM repeat protein